MVNNGYSVEVKGTGLKDDQTRFASHAYKLKQFHFHAGSEHKIDSVRYALEVQFVHQRSDGQVLVLSVLFKEGDTNGAIAQLGWDSLAQDAERTIVAFDPTDLLPASRDYWFYHGSFTTPPCTENVRWVVLKTQPTISAAQAAAFPLKRNYRPVQPLGNRYVSSNGPHVSKSVLEKAFMGNKDAGAQVAEFGQDINDVTSAKAKAPETMLNLMSIVKRKMPKAHSAAEVKRNREILKLLAKVKTRLQRQASRRISAVHVDESESTRQLAAAAGDGEFEQLLATRRRLDAEQDSLAAELSESSRRLYSDD